MIVHLLDGNFVLSFSLPDNWTSDVWLEVISIYEDTVLGVCFCNKNSMCGNISGVCVCVCACVHDKVFI